MTHSFLPLSEWGDFSAQMVITSIRIYPDSSRGKVTQLAILYLKLINGRSTIPYTTLTALR